MVVFDNLANILETIIVTDYRLADYVSKEWKLLGEESHNRIVVGWTFESVDTSRILTCIGLYNTTKNTLNKIFTYNGRINIIQASVSPCATLVSYVVRNETSQPYYRHFLVAASEDETNNILPSLTHDCQIMSTFLDSSKLIRVLILIHNECVWLQQMDNSEDSLKVVKRDKITGSFSWAQWDIATRSLYFINNRKSTVIEDDLEKQELAPTLTALQFHPDLPHETVFNIPLNLSSLTTSAPDVMYEDDCVPLRVHDCSLDLLVITDSSGLVCICHHYLYQPVKPPSVKPAVGNPANETTENVNFAYSVTLLHHGCVVHCTIPDVPWSIAKTLRPAFTMLGSQYLLVYGAGVVTHLLDVGMAHEPVCHIHLPSSLRSVEEAARLVPLHAVFSDTKGTDVLTPSVMLHLNSMDLLEVEVTLQDILNAFEHFQNVSNRLAILHYFLVHLKDFELVEEALQILLVKPEDINMSSYIQEMLIGGTYAMTQRHLPNDATNLLALLPMTGLHPSGKLEIVVKERRALMSQEILWNTAMMLLSPQQRLVPYRSDIWTRLWEKLSMCSETSRFKHSHVAEKLCASLACYQPEALSRCTTPMSPAAGFFPACSFMEAVTRKTGNCPLPFHETDSCTASRQEHITSVNMRELNMYLMKKCSREAPMHIHAVTTRYVTAQLDMAKQACSILCCVVGPTELLYTQKGFSLIRQLDERIGQLLLTCLLRYHHAVNLLAFPLPPGFSSFFCYLGFTFLPFNLFLQYLNSNVFQLQVDVMKEILKDSEDVEDNVNMKLKLLLSMPRSRAKRLLNTWNHPVSLMLRAREHALNVLSGVQSTRPKAHVYARKSINASRGLAAFPSGDRVSPLDTFLDLLTAKASLTELDFNLLIDATLSSTEEFL